MECLGGVFVIVYEELRRSLERNPVVKLLVHDKNEAGATAAKGFCELA